MNVRPETLADRAAVFEINHLAFGREAEARLVDALRASGVARVSLVAELGGEIIGHVLFSRLPIHTTTGVIEALSDCR
jgi:putative acetyltransferase